jgi:nicotinate-nucleotide adenylyltransferase
VKLAIENNPNFRTSDIEFTLPKPSYTIDTLTHLKEKYPKHIFSIIMGGDNLTSLQKWKNADIILRDFSIYVYNRNNETNPYKEYKNIHFLEFPQLDISATFIRNTIKEGLSVQYFVPDNVCEYIEENNYYKK